MQNVNNTDASAEIQGKSSPVRTENTSIPSTSKENASTSSILNENASTSNQFNDTAEFLSTTETTSSSEQEMLRRRRLQKFSPSPTTE